MGNRIINDAVYLAGKLGIDWIGLLVEGGNVGKIGVLELTSTYRLGFK